MSYKQKIASLIVALLQQGYTRGSFYTGDEPFNHPAWYRFCNNQDSYCFDRACRAIGIVTYWL